MIAVAIEPLNRRDLDEVLEIEVEQFDEPWTITMLDDELGNPACRYTKACEHGRIVGYLGVMVVDDEVHVHSIATRRDAEGRGIATALLADALRAAIDKGARHGTLEVAARNLRAQRLYERFGFAPVGVRRAYYRRPVDDAIVMWVHDLHLDAYAERLAAIEAA